MHSKTAQFQMCAAKQREKALAQGRMPRAFAVVFLLSFFAAAQNMPTNTPLGTGGSLRMEADLASAQQGDMNAQVKVAKAYNEGTGGRRNYSEAFKWFTAASNQGSTEATAWLGSLYLTGHGVSQDTNRAAALIQTSANANNPVGLRFLGLMYETGQGVPRDYRKAVDTLVKAVKLKDPESFDKLGTLFLRGLGVKKDLKRAQQLFRKGARLGDSWAQLNLGEMFESGNYVIATSTRSKAKSQSSGVDSVKSTTLSGVSSGSKPVKGKPNLVRARKLFALSAAQGNRVAAFKLGEMYETGNGTVQDYIKAISFYGQAATQQYAPAQLALGKITEMGLGTPINLPYAYAWYSLASAQDNAMAAGRLHTLSRKLSPDQLQQGQALLAQVEQKISQN